ncbi:MAG: guanylate kinase [Candidatus Hydrogenedentes bacterium]|nr:guanylate kinase [Candidatus Hydrogenedentota bacterium]
MVSAPSGAGKHTILRQVLAHDPDLAQAITATTRPPRRSEMPGKDYYFLDRNEFQEKVRCGYFAEWAEVHGNLYGTPASELTRLLNSGRDVLLQVDVQGMRNLRQGGHALVSIFIMPPSLDELERRLQRRGADSAETIALRVRNARDEMLARDAYDHVIVNEDLDRAVKEFEALVSKYRLETVS